MAIIATAYAARSGFEVIARLGELLFPLVVVMYLVGAVTVVKEVDLSLIKPVLAQPPAVLAQASVTSAAGFMYVTAMAVIFPNITHQEGMRRLTFLGFVLIGIINSFITFLIIGTFGPAQAQAMTFPGLELVRYVSIADIIERLDPLIMIIWVGTTYLKISVFLYCAAVGIAHVCGLKNYRPLVLPLGTIIAGVGIIMFPSFIVLTDWLTAGWVVQNYIFQLGIFILLLLVALARNIRGTERRG
jgi:spore germination protein KB